MPPARARTRPSPVSRALAATLAAALAAACGPTPPSASEAKRLLGRGDFAGADKVADQELARFPKHPTLWHIKIHAAMGRGDSAGAVALYESWRELRGSHDRSALRTMAKTTLWQGLRVPSTTLRVQAIQAIERLEVEKLAPDVADRIIDDDDLVAAAAAVALLRSHPGAPRVATDLLRSEDPRARAIVVEGIGRKIRGAARADLRAAAGDADPAVRLAAVTAIGALASGDDTAWLAEIAGADPDGDVRAAALRGLAEGRRGDTLAVAEAALSDAHQGARLAAVALLATAGERARPALEALTLDDDLLVALRATVALDGRGDAPLQGTVERGLADPSAAVRIAAIDALGRWLPLETQLTLLGSMLDDRRVEVRLAASRALLGHGVRTRPFEELYAALDHQRDEPRLEAAVALTRLDDPRGLEALAALTRRPTPSTRSEAVRAHRHARRPTPPLIAALADESPPIRIVAAETLLLLLD